MYIYAGACICACLLACVWMCVWASCLIIGEHNLKFQPQLPRTLKPNSVFCVACDTELLGGGKQALPSRLRECQLVNIYRSGDDFSCVYLFFSFFLIIYVLCFRLHLFRFLRAFLFICLFHLMSHYDILWFLFWCFCWYYGIYAFRHCDIH